MTPAAAKSKRCEIIAGIYRRREEAAATTAATAQQLAPGLHKRKRDEHTFDPDRKYLCYACYEEIIPIFEDGVCQNIERICHEYGVRYFHTNCAPTVQPGRKRRSK